MSYTLSYAQGGLPAAADYIRSKGRDEDSRLVHMTPGEVDALQQMAVQHGGSLTINPETGLPEAGFLKDLLRVALPVGLAVFGGPAAAALGGKLGLSGALAQGVGMGLLSGGLGTLMTGDLKQGLGMGLTSGLMSGAMASFGGAKVDPSAVKTPVAAQVIPQATTAPVNQGLTSMMQNPTIINPVQAQNAAGFNLANAQRGINAQMVNPSGATLANTTQAAQMGVVNPPPTTEAGTGLLDRFNRLSTPAQLGIGAAGLGALGAMSENKFKPQPVDKGEIRPYTYSANPIGQEYYNGPMYDERGYAILDKGERDYYNPSYTAQPVYKAAQGGLMSAPFIEKSMYPQGQQIHTNFATPTQMPTSEEVVNADYGAKQNPFMGTPMGMAQGGLPRDSSPTGNMSYGYMNRQTQPMQMPQKESFEYTYDPETQTFNKVMPAPAEGSGRSYSIAEHMFGNPSLPRLPNMGAMSGASFGNGLFGGMLNKIVPQVTGGGENQYQYNQDTQQFTKMAGGGLSTLGGYSDGGRMLKGPGDGMSDNIPATIGDKQPARLADGEFVVPADVVSHLGNGSTDAGAKRLYNMMDKVRHARTGNKKQGKQIKADKYLPV